MKTGAVQHNFTQCGMSFATTLLSAFLAAHLPSSAKSLVLDKPPSVLLKDSAEHKTHR